MRKCVLAMVFMVSAAMGMVRSYAVDPIQASWSGWTRRGDTVTQVLTVNFDLPVKAALFCGASGGGGRYNVAIRTYPGGLDIASGDTVDPGSYAWATCTLQVLEPDSFVKGRQVEVRWTRAGQDSIEYFWDRTDPYQNPYGWMELGGDQPPPQSSDDLAMKLFGLMNLVDSSYWGMNPAFNDWDVDTLKQRWVARARGAGVGAVRCPVTWYWAQLNSPGDSFYFGNTDSSYTYMHDSAGCEVMNLLFLTPPWASTRIDSFLLTDTGGRRFWRHETSANCPPVNLFEPVSSTANYWARFVEAAVRKYPDVRLVELWNESNDGCTTKVTGVDGWWRRPNRFYHPDTFAGNRGLCSLYMRLCEVATTVIKGEHPGHRVFIGALARVNDANPGQNLIAGREWLELCYGIGTRGNTVRPFWDGVTVHPYQPGAAFDDARFAADAETLRAIMREYGHGGIGDIILNSYHLSATSPLTLLPAVCLTRSEAAHMILA